MALSGLPPSSNWYSSSTCDANKTGVLAYASRNSVVLLNISEDGQSLIGFLHGHEQRVAAVAFNKLEDQWLATCGDDSLVKVWNWRSKSVHKEHKCHESKVTSVSWNPSKKDVLTTGDDKGKIISWNQTDDGFDCWSPEREPIACLAYSNGADQWLAVGYKRGLILILDTRKKKQAVLSRLRGHDDDVHSMCWSPSLTSTDSAPADLDADSTVEPSESFLLSGGEDHHVRIWSPHEEKMVHAFKLPPKGGTKSKGHGDNRSSKGRLWVTVWWPQDMPEQFLSSSFGGDILFWDLNKSGKQKWVILDSTESHNRPVYSLLSIREKFFLTSSMDRQLILWNLETRNTCWSTPTLGGFIYQLVVAPKDTATIAMGVGDNMIRVWNTNARGASCKSTTLWQGLRSKVTVICWHPEKEGVLAFGSEDGRVGIFTAINPSKAPNLSRTFHKKTVYSLSFGPHCCKPDEPIDDRRNCCLYSCGGEGVVYQHHDDYSLHQEAVGIDAIIRSSNSLQHMFPLRSEVSWRSDRKVVALGNDDGSIEIFSAPHLSMLCTIEVHHKIINCLQWFPCQTLQGQRSPLQYCLASGSNETAVHVHDLAKVLGQEEHNPSEVFTTAFRSFSGHLLRVTSLQWNPLADGKLASVSYDGTAQIWDVSKGEAFANFRGHHGRLLSVAWSHLDPDEIFTGGEDFCVMKWRISECTHQQPPKDKKELNVKFYNSGSSNKEGKKKKKKNKDLSVFSKGSNNSAPIKDGDSPSTVIGGETAPETSGDMGAEESNASPMSIPETNDKKLVSITELLEKKRRELTGELKADGASMREDEIAHVSESGGLEPSEFGVKAGEDGENKMKNAEEAENLEDVEKTGSKAKRKKGKSYFPVCSQLDNRGKQWFLKDCLEIAERNYGQTTTDVLSQDLTHLGLFTSKRDLSQTMTVEGRHHEEHGNMDFRLWLDVWQGKFLTVLREAMHKGQLSDKMVAMAPQAGYDVWLETCSAYAKQLEQNRDSQKAATYYICCHQIHDAVRVLKENKHFREAASVATARLSTQDAVRIDVYRTWAAHLEEDHKHEAAARCYLAIDEPINAAKLLARGGSQAGLRAALGVAISADNKEILYSLVSRYANECMLYGDWSEVWKLSSSDVSILCLHLVMIIHEAIVIALLRSDDPSSVLDIFNELKHSHHLEDVSTVQGLDHFSGWPSLMLGGTKPLLSAAVSIWEAEDHPFDVASKADILEAMTKLFVPTYDSRILRQFLISGAVAIALDWMEDAAGINKLYSRTENILQECLRVGDVNLMKTLLSLVYPNGFFVDMLRDSPPGVTVDESYAAGLTEACYAYAVLYHLWWDRTVNIDQGTSMQGIQNSSAQRATDASTQLESPLSDESDGINFHRAVPSPLASSEIEANGSLSAVAKEGTRKALPSDEKQSDITPEDEEERSDLSTRLSDVSIASGRDHIHFKFVLKRTKICRKVLVRTNAVLWYRLRMELKHIQVARNHLCSEEAKSNGVTADGSDESSMEKECNSLVSREEVKGTSSCQVTSTEVASDTGHDSSQLEHLPMFKKYLVPGVTMETLVEEESRLEQELADLDVEAEPPDPIESLLVIASLSTKFLLSGFRETDGEFTPQALVACGVENSCTKSQQRHFMNLKTKLDKVNQS